MQKLHRAQEKQLETWIGSGPKSFSLLYSFSSNGASASTFHQLCDNKGPSVTVLYNTAGSIYGGYAESSWNSSGTYPPDSNGFLFCLAISGNEKFEKFPNITGSQGMYCDASYGPTFGAGHDLHTAISGNFENSPYITGSHGMYNDVGYYPTVEEEYEVDPAFFENEQFEEFSYTESHAMYYDGSSGAGHDLHTFSGTVISSGNRYILNGYSNFGNSYSMKGLSTRQITNGVQTVYDLQVYSVSVMRDTIDIWKCPEYQVHFKENLQRMESKAGQFVAPAYVVLDLKPPDLNVQICSTAIASYTDPDKEYYCKKRKLFLHDLKEEVEQYAPPKQLKLKATNILVLGPVGAGKSSFFNTIASVFRGYVTGQACSGSAEQSVTSKYRMYSVRQNVSAKPLRFRLCDTRGLEESQGIDSMEISYILDGHVPDGYQFNPSTSINSDINGFKNKPTLDDKIHCVCFVIDSTTVNVLSEKMVERIKAIKSRIHQKGIPQVVLATKVDKVSSHVEEDLSSVFKSDAICKIVENVSQILGFPRGHVLPMKNYEKEIETSDDINILALLSLRQMLRATEDYMFSCLDAFEDLSLGSEDGHHS